MKEKTNKKGGKEYNTESERKTSKERENKKKKIAKEKIMKEKVKDNYNIDKKK